MLLRACVSSTYVCMYFRMLPLGISLREMSIKQIILSKVHSLLVLTETGYLIDLLDLWSEEGMTEEEADSQKLVRMYVCSYNPYHSCLDC